MSDPITRDEATQLLARMNELAEGMSKLTEATLALSKVNIVTARSLVTLLKERTGGRVVTQIGEPTDMPMLEARLSALKDGSWRPGEPTEAERERQATLLQSIPSE